MVDRGQIAAEETQSSPGAGLMHQGVEGNPRRSQTAINVDPNDQNMGQSGHIIDENFYKSTFRTTSNLV